MRPFFLPPSSGGTNLVLSVWSETMLLHCGTPRVGGCCSRAIHWASDRCIIIAATTSSASPACQRGCTRSQKYPMRPTRNGSQSFFVGIERVEPGHVVNVSAEGLAIRRHWQPCRQPIALRRPEDYSETLRNLLDQAVSCRLRGTGDVGACLSGGLDSGAVVSTAARLLAGSGRRVIAFTAAPREGYHDPAGRNRIIDEGPYAAATAALYPNVEHVLVRNEGRSPLADLDRGFFLLDRPFFGICATGWSTSMDNAIRKRKLRVILNA